MNHFLPTKVRRAAHGKNVRACVWATLTSVAGRRSSTSWHRAQCQPSPNLKTTSASLIPLRFILLVVVARGEAAKYYASAGADKSKTDPPQGKSRMHFLSGLATLKGQCRNFTGRTRGENRQKTPLFGGWRRGQSLPFGFTSFYWHWPWIEAECAISLISTFSLNHPIQNKC